MADFVVDTNVPKIANGGSDQAGPRCVIACLDALEEARAGRLVLDDAWLVVREYSQQLSSTGQPGPGDAFLKWVLTNRANPLRCRLERLATDDAGELVDFPSASSLADFDRADRKWIALARRTGAQILQGIDHEWWSAKDALAAEGVDVRFLCPDESRGVSRAKRARGQARASS